MSLINRYRRKYFQSADRKFRITIDTDMESYQPTQTQCLLLNKSTDRFNTVLELKYTKEWDQYAHTITNYFPFRVTKHSKYAIGIEQSNLS